MYHLSSMERRKDTDLDDLIEDIITDAYGDEEQFEAFRQAFEDQVSLPTEAQILGETVRVIVIDYDGNSRRGITVTCRHSGDQQDHVFSIADVVFTDPSMARVHAAYRKWLGLSPAIAVPKFSAAKSRRRPAKMPELPDAGTILDLIVLRVKQVNTNCRMAGSETEVIFRSGDLWGVAPGEILTVKSQKIWQHRKNIYVSGEIQNRRIDASALGLKPLILTDEGPWDPAENLESDDGESPDDTLRKILERGTRTQYEMESVLPGYDLKDALDDPFSDPVVESIELRDSGDVNGAREILTELLAEDLRCLDAHAHLGNLEFDRFPERALPHYEIGVRIGELSVTANFEGILPWVMISNRPFLRCLYGYGLCLWRLKRFKKASEVFERLLWLDPRDPLDALSCLSEASENRPCKDPEGND